MRQVMIIMLRHKVQVIHEPHRLLQPRMQHRARKKVLAKRLQAPHQCKSSIPKIPENLLHWPLVVVRLVSLPISQVRHREFRSSNYKILHPRAPQRLQVEQVPRMFLRRPLPRFLSNKNLPRTPTQNLFHPRRRSPQTHHQVRIGLHRKRKLELAFKPRRHFAHKSPLLPPHNQDAQNPQPTQRFLQPT